ncbi:MAG: hypothetical protein Q9181_006644 [Wetmoreana brouardii]
MTHTDPPFADCSMPDTLRHVAYTGGVGPIVVAVGQLLCDRRFCAAAHRVDKQYAATVVYCLYFHPLAKYPGPFWAKFSVWPSYYHSLKGDRHIWIWQCHQLYGPIFRYGPNALLFNSPKALWTIYDSRSNVQKAKFYEMHPWKAGAFNTWNCTNKLVHARKRRILNAAFSDKAIRAAEPYVIQHADRWCQLLLNDAGDVWSAPRDMAEWSNGLVFDILGLTPPPFPRRSRHRSIPSTQLT